MRKLNGNRKVRAGGTLVLGMAMFLAAGVALGGEPPLSSATEVRPNYSDIISDIKKRADAQTGKNWIEPADAVLNLRRDLEQGYGFFYL